MSTFWVLGQLWEIPMSAGAQSLTLPATSVTLRPRLEP